jgi:hypothetical protein
LIPLRQHGTFRYVGRCLPIGRTTTREYSFLPLFSLGRAK